WAPAPSNELKNGWKHGVRRSGPQKTVTESDGEALGRQRHLELRGARRHSSRAFPHDERRPQRESGVRLALRTSPPEEALPARPEAERQFWAAVDAARASRAERRQEAPGEAASQSLAVDWFRRQLVDFEDLRELEQKDPARLGSALAQATDDLADARRELAEE